MIIQSIITLKSKNEPYHQNNIILTLLIIQYSTSDDLSFKK